MITRTVTAGFAIGTAALGAAVVVGEQATFVVLLLLTCAGLAVGRFSDRDRYAEPTVPYVGSQRVRRTAARRSSTRWRSRCGSFRAASCPS